jgi:imidazolonepropionase-like amidohydrolase
MVDLKIIRCGKLITCDEGGTVENAIIVINGSRIIDLGEESEIDIPKDAEEIDYSDETILPALIDTHLHLALGPGENYEEQFRWSDGIQLSSGIVNSRLTLDSGVTTALDLGARNQVNIELKAAADMGIIKAPRLMVCGRPITMTGGHFHFCNAEADGPSQVRWMVRKLLKEGVDFIKAMTSGGGTKGTRRELASYTVPEIKAAVEEAERHDKWVTAHCHSSEAIANSVEAGVAIIEHCTFLERDGRCINHVFRDDIARGIVKEGIYVDNVLNPQQTDQKRLTWAFENFRRLNRLGAKILPGTDGLRLYQTSNMALSLEMRVRAGMPHIEAIKSATKYSAEALGLDNQIGTIQTGRYADLIAVRGDPLQDITVLRNPVLVMKSGNIIPYSGRVEAKMENQRLAGIILPILDDLGYRL